MINKRINTFNKKCKEVFLKDIDEKVDKGMLELVNAINSIPDLVTINCCQGELIEEEQYEHCPRTYVDFYVLNNNYDMANNLFAEIVGELGSIIKCSVEYEADFDFIDENSIEENGYINLRYSIDFIDIQDHIFYMTANEIYRKVINIVSEFKLKFLGDDRA